MQTTDQETTKDVETTNRTADPASGSAPAGSTPRAPASDASRKGPGMARLKALSGKALAWLKTTSRKAGGWLKAKPPGKEGEAAGGAPGAGKARWNALKSRLKRVFVEQPKRAYSSYEKKVPSKKRRQAINTGAGVAVVVLAGFLLWPGSGSGPPAPGKERCYFNARPAAKLFIDGELIASVVPEQKYVDLEVGKHSVRFVSPDEVTREVEIEVVAGEPKLWVWSFPKEHLFVFPAEERAR